MKSEQPLWAFHKVKNSLKSIYERLIKINDTPQKIAIGFGMGVFLGIFPGVGPVASLILATLMRVNQLAALTGSLLTNTWISVVTFALAVKVGSAMVGEDWTHIYAEGKTILKDFHWKNLGDVAILKIIKPLVLGYVVVSFVIGFVAYLLVLVILIAREKSKKTEKGKL